MKSSISNSFHVFSLLLGMLSFAILLTITACGSATPTRAPATSTGVALAQGTPTVAITPTLAPSATVAATGTVTASVPATATKVAQFVTPTHTRAAQAATPRPAASGALSGRIFYSVVSPGDDYKFRTIWVANADGSGAHQVLERGMWPVLSTDGSRLAYFRPYDGISLANSDGGSPVLIVPGGGLCCLDWSQDMNWIVYVESIKVNQPGGPIKKVKLDGTYKTIVDLRVQGNGPSFSPDGKEIAYAGCQTNSATCGIFVVNADGGPARILTTDAGGLPQWSADGKRIVYQASDGGHINVFVVNADGTGRKQLTKGTGQDAQPIFTRDGGHIVWRSDQGGTGWAIFVMNANGTGERKIIPSAPPHPDFWAWEPLSTGP